MPAGNVPVQLQLDPTQPWLSENPAVALKNEERAAERRALLADLANSRLATIEQKTALILRSFPETRDSDTALLIRYWNRFQADVLLKTKKLAMEVLFELENIDSITRARRHIQNDLSLFQATRRTMERRSELQMQFSEYIAARKEGDAEIRFYLDETGNDPSDRFVGIGGICVLDWRLFEPQHAALSTWRETLPPETLHMNRLTDDSKLGPFLALLNELRKRRAGLMFVGYALPSRKNRTTALFDLTVQLLVDALHKAETLGCLNVLRAVTVVKEREDGFDQLFLAEMHRTLHEQLGREFPGRAYLKAITPLAKGREVLLECADTIASAMRRRAVSGGAHSKDKLAEAVMNVTGLEDSEDNGAMFKSFWPG